MKHVAVISSSTKVTRFSLMITLLGSGSTSEVLLSQSSEISTTLANHDLHAVGTVL